LGIMWCILNSASYGNMWTNVFHGKWILSSQ
jgi:hypothetical protein